MNIISNVVLSLALYHVLYTCVYDYCRIVNVTQNVAMALDRGGAHKLLPLINSYMRRQ